MPIKGWKCPIERTQVPFDHFETCKARKGRAAFPPWMARHAHLKIENDVRHSTLDVTATRTMNCPRQTFIEVLWDYYIDPSKIAARERGTALHSVAAEHTDPKLWYTEANDPVRMTINGEIGGVPLSMACDAMKRDMTEIVDYKFPSDFSVRFRGPKAKKEYACQVNMARLMLGQQEWALQAGYDPETVLLTIWDHACGKQEGPLAQEAPHMTEEEILATRPGGSNHTIEEIISIHLWMVQEYEKNGAPTDIGKLEEIAAQIPLVGEPMFRGDKCRMYCDVSEICFGIVRKYGRPEATWGTEDESPSEEQHRTDGRVEEDQGPSVCSTPTNAGLQKAVGSSVQKEGSSGSPRFSPTK